MGEPSITRAEVRQYDSVIPPFNMLKFIHESRERRIAEIKKETREAVGYFIGEHERRGEDGMVLRELNSLIPHILRRLQCYDDRDIDGAAEPIRANPAVSITVFSTAMIMATAGINRPLIGEIMRVRLEFLPDSQVEEKVAEYREKLQAIEDE